MSPVQEIFICETIRVLFTPFFTLIMYNYV